jgi:hypothetical protein
MVSTKMAGEAYDLLQNIMESGTQEYSGIKSFFQENFHGDEDSDYYQNKFDEIQRKSKEIFLNYAFSLKTIYQRAYLSVEEKATQLRFLRQKFLQGLDHELQHIVRYKKVFSFEELVAVTHKYAKRGQLDQQSKDQKVFVNSVAANDQKDSLIVQAIEKQNETICAIATSLKMGNKPAEANVYNNSAKNPNFNNRLDRLTESMINLGGLLQANMETNNSSNQNSVGQSNNYNQQNHQSSAPRNNFNMQRPNTRFQQPVGRETYLFDSQPSHYPNPNLPPLDFSLQPPVLQFPQPPLHFPSGYSAATPADELTVSATVPSFSVPQPTFQLQICPQQSGIKCTNCELTNHNIETCYRNQRQALDAKVCFYCKNTGHRAN